MSIPLNIYTGGGDMVDYKKHYKTVYLKDDELEKLAKETGENISTIIKDLMKDGYEYRRRISDGEWQKK